MDNKEENKEKKPNIKFIVTLIIVVLILFVGVPVFVNVAYINGGGITTVWDGPQFLAFYGAVLSAIGAIFLGAVSIWQNYRLQKANEIAQKRLEKINTRANELNIISKIIEHEESRLMNLSEKGTELEELCNSAYILNTLNKASTEEYNKICLELYKKNSILLSSIESCLSLDVKYDVEFRLVAVKLSGEANRLFKTHFKNKTISEDVKEESEKLDELNSSFAKMKYDYLTDYHSKLNLVIFKDMSLVEIRRLYERPKEDKNGQAENAE